MNDDFIDIDAISNEEKIKVLVVDIDTGATEILSLTETELTEQFGENSADDIRKDKE